MRLCLRLLLVCRKYGRRFGKILQQTKNVLSKRKTKEKIFNDTYCHWRIVY